MTREGEDILAELDAAGIAELRRLQLVWSGRSGNDADIIPDFSDEVSGTGIRVISNIDIHSLRLFFLSLLWRCAASERPEVSQIRIPASKLEDLRRMVVERRHTPIAAYPFLLTQLVQVGDTHNHAPMVIMMPSVTLYGKLSKPVPAFRFYLDGLIVNYIRKPTQATPPFPFDEDGNRMVIMTQTTEQSFQMRNLRRAIIDANRGWPGVMSKLGDT